jgi:hypothetical protein
LVARHDAESRFVEALRTVDCFPVPEVGTALRRDQLCRNPQSYLAIERASPSGVAFRIGALNEDIVAKEAGGLRPCVADQGLGLGEFQLELVAQERPELFLDPLRLEPGTVEPQQEIIRVPDITQSPIGRVVRVAAG